MEPPCGKNQKILLDIIYSISKYVIIYRQNHNTQKMRLKDINHLDK